MSQLMIDEFYSQMNTFIFNALSLLGGGCLSLSHTHAHTHHTTPQHTHTHNTTHTTTQHSHTIIM